MDLPTHAAATPRGRTPSGGELAGLGLFLAAAVLIPLLAGIIIGSLLGAGAIFIFIGLVVGIAAGVAVVYTRARQYL